MEVKILKGKNLNFLESTVNEFLKDKALQNIDLKYLNDEYIFIVQYFEVI